MSFTKGVTVAFWETQANTRNFFRKMKIDIILMLFERTIYCNVLENSFFSGKFGL